jgi:hypothetical protein
VIRCVKCGCSRWDSQGVGCILCNGSPARRSEIVHVSSDTKGKLEGSFPSLETFGLIVEAVPMGEPLLKPAGRPAETEHDLRLNFSEPMDPNALQELVSHLHFLGVPKPEIFRLRLAEPEEIESALAATV